MAQRKFSKEEIIEKTKAVLHSFYSGDISAVADIMGKKCVWIGNRDSQYTYGKEAFISEMQSESENLSARILQEEYALIFHEMSYSAVYGQYTIAREAKEEDEGENDTILQKKVRFTFVWKQVEDSLLAIHIHCTDSGDVSLQSQPAKVETSSENPTWLDYIREVDDPTCKSGRVLLRDSHGLIHPILPVEILYILTANRITTVYTESGTFDVKYSLLDLERMCPFLLRIHNNCLVHPIYIRGLRRGSVTLYDQTELPVSRRKFNSVRDALPHI